MSVNPDVANRHPDKWAPRQSELRFIEKEIVIEGTEVPKKVRILQQWQFSAQLERFGWFDIPLEVEE